MDWSNILENLTEAGIRLIIGAVVLVICAILIRWFKKLIAKSKLIKKMEPTVGRYMRNLFTALMYIIMIVLVAGIMGIPTTIFVTVVSLAGAAVSLALQGALGNLFGGILILILHPFKAGQYITVGDSSGTVLEIGLFYTVLITFDGKRIDVPNSSLTSSSIINYSSEEKRRIDLDFPVVHSASQDDVRKALLDMALATEMTLLDPAPVVVLQEFTTSAVVYRLRLYVKNKDYWDLYYYLTEEGKKALNKAGLEIPVQQIDLRVKQ